ncbi:trypsin-like serine peptidase [Risungbinella massiliensis]|uniref:trypsin-like serine peptidase n=1 Tax=Risungbinella massiliensis TaxID=1329796 RepID=UPI0005CC5453|nr:serine protease [Risungbinella massiliensis]
MTNNINLSTREHSLWEGKNKKVETETRGLELLVGDNNLLSISFLKRGIERSKAVALIKLPNGWATGFLVSKDLLLTNHHVFPTAQAANESQIIFNFENDIYGNPEPVDIYVGNSNDFFWSNESLDYALVKVNKRSNLNVIENVDYTNALGLTDKVQPGERWGFISLISQTNIGINQRVNIIQHPSGRMKEIALHDNRITDINPNQTIIKYTTDSEPGSSGSPGFTDTWDLVFLHHSSGDVDANGICTNNEGILISAIVNDLIQSLKDEKGMQILFELGIAGVKEFSYGSSPASNSPDLKITRSDFESFNNINYNVRVILKE